MSSFPTPGSWHVEPPAPSDRGLVARLLEAVVAADPSVAPEVADRSVRPAQWLQRPRPGWTGVVVEPGAEHRTVIGYAAVAPDDHGALRLSHLLVSPAWADRGVEAALGEAATEALAGPVAAPAPATDDEGLEIGAVTYPAERVERPRRRAALLGAGAIVLVGTLGVLAVQVGTGPLGSVLPFLAPDPVVPAADSGPTPAPDAPATPLPALDPVPGATLSPAPAAPSTPGAPGGPGAPQPPGPTAPPPGTTPPGPTPDGPGTVSSLLDPVVATVVSTVDGLTGNGLSPVTGTVEETTDGLTDVLDDAVDLVVGLLPAQR